jgi:excisionase family DNA binding protein
MSAAATGLEPLLTVQDVAELLQVSRAAVYALVKAKKIPTVDVGLRKTRFRRSDLAAFIGEDDSR